MLQDNSWMEIWARFRVKSEVQRRQVHNWTCAHGQRQRLGYSRVQEEQQYPLNNIHSLTSHMYRFSVSHQYSLHLKHFLRENSQNLFLFLLLFSAFFYLLLILLNPELFLHSNRIKGSGESWEHQMHIQGKKLETTSIAEIKWCWDQDDRKHFLERLTWKRRKTGGKLMRVFSFHCFRFVCVTHFEQLFSNCRKHPDFEQLALWLKCILYAQINFAFFLISRCKSHLSLFGETVWFHLNCRFTVINKWEEAFFAVSTDVYRCLL